MTILISIILNINLQTKDVQKKFGLSDVNVTKLLKNANKRKSQEILGSFFICYQVKFEFIQLYLIFEFFW